MATTGMNASMVLSIGIFFTLIIVGLSASLPAALFHGLTAHGVPAAAARKVSHLPPTASVFAAFLGYNPVENLLGPSGVLRSLPHAQSAFLTGRSFFPTLIAKPFGRGLHEALDFAAAACLVAAAASVLMGRQYFYKAPEAPVDPADAAGSRGPGGSAGSAAGTAAGTSQPRPQGDRGPEPEWQAQPEPQREPQPQPG